MLANTDIYTDFAQFAEMRQDAKTQSSESIKQVAKQFESLFVQMMLKSMRDAVPEGGLFNSDQQKMYQDMYDKQLSLNIAQGQGVGLAAVIERQLGGQVADEKQGTELGDYLHNSLNVMQMRRQADSMVASETGQNFSAEAISAANKGQSSNETGGMNWDQPEDFIENIWPQAEKAAEELGVSPDVLIAQSALETGWGRYTRCFENGQNSNNLFGIKAGQHWQGNTINVSTLEFTNGAMQREQAQFRAYDSVDDAFSDYVDFIQSHPRYQQALEKGSDPEAYARELQKAGYATDPDYAKKIDRIRNSDLLQSRLSELKNIQNQPIT